MLRVPGVTDTPVTPREMAELMNWLIAEFYPELQDFRPFSAEEVINGRATRLANPLEVRQSLLGTRPKTECRHLPVVRAVKTKPLPFGHEPAGAFAAKICRSHSPGHLIPDKQRESGPGTIKKALETDSSAFFERFNKAEQIVQRQAERQMRERVSSTSALLQNDSNCRLITKAS